MLSWSFEFEGRDYFEGFRSLATNGVDKPILNYFRMLGLMGGNRVAVTSNGAVPLETQVRTGVREAADVDGLASAQSRSAAVLVWNYHDADEPAPESPVQIAVRGIPAGVHRVLVEHFRVDATHSNAYSAWQQMGSPQQPTPEQYAELRAAGGLQLLTSPEWLDVHDGGVRVATTMPRESVSLLRLRW